MIIAACPTGTLTTLTLLRARRRRAGAVVHRVRRVVSIVTVH